MHCRKRLQVTKRRVCNDKQEGSGASLILCILVGLLRSALQFCSRCCCRSDGASVVSDKREGGGGATSQSWRCTARCSGPRNVKVCTLPERERQLRSKEIPRLSHEGFTSHLCSRLLVSMAATDFHIHISASIQQM